MNRTPCYCLSAKFSRTLQFSNLSVTMTPHQVSVIIPSYNSFGTIAKSLAALQKQQTDAAFEIVVIDSSTDGAADLIENEFPGVSLIRSEQRLYPGAARNLGISTADGEILAFTDADCIADPGWIEAIVQAHKSDESVIGGIVENANPDNSVGWGYYFTEFNHWSPGAAKGHVTEIPTCCLSMKRQAYDRWGPFRAEGYCSDTLFHWRRAKDGEFPYLDPAIRVGHINPGGLFHMLEHEAFHGKYFARVRARYQRLSKSRLLLNLISAPLLPFLLFGRAATRVYSRGHYRSEFLRYALQTFAGIFCWSAGEFAGYLSCALSPQTTIYEHEEATEDSQSQ
jgi:glycosyltransferase involved in cell wall biosynthesis